MKVVVAPNAYKGSLTASEAAAAIARGVRQVFPDAEIVEVPVADGGDGTVDALVSAHSGEYRTVQVEGPLGDPVQASYGLIEGGRTGVVELALASGLTLIPPVRRDPRKTSTCGFGQLLVVVRADGVQQIIAGIGVQQRTTAAQVWRKPSATGSWMRLALSCRKEARGWCG